MFHRHRFTKHPQQQSNWFYRPTRNALWWFPNRIPVASKETKRRNGPNSRSVSSFQRSIRLRWRRLYTRVLQRDVVSFSLAGHRLQLIGDIVFWRKDAEFIWQFHCWRSPRTPVSAKSGKNWTLHTREIWGWTKNNFSCKDHRGKSGTGSEQKERVPKPNRTR